MHNQIYKDIAKAISETCNNNNNVGKDFLEDLITNFCKIFETTDKEFDPNIFIIDIMLLTNYRPTNTL